MGDLTETDIGLSIPKFFIIIYYIGIENNLKMVSIYKKMSITYAHLCKLIKVMEKKGWVKIIKHGRTLEVRLTDKGKKIFNSVMSFFKATGLNPGQYYKYKNEN